jgi:aspartate carbamoyltransferase catalytic subunit
VPSLGEFTQTHGLTLERARKLRPGVLIMHPGPMNRGVEIDSRVADLPAAVIERQVTNGVPIRMAVLYLTVAGSKEGSRP